MKGLIFFNLTRNEIRKAYLTTLTIFIIACQFSLFFSLNLPPLLGATLYYNRNLSPSYTIPMYQTILTSIVQTQIIAGDLNNQRCRKDVLILLSEWSCFIFIIIIIVFSHTQHSQALTDQQDRLHMLNKVIQWRFMSKIVHEVQLEIYWRQVRENICNAAKHDRTRSSITHCLYSLRKKIKNKTKQQKNRKENCNQWYEAKRLSHLWVNHSILYQCISDVIYSK